MQCWICTRQARGLGLNDKRYPRTDARHYAIDWVFCSLRCQRSFALLVDRWHDRNLGNPPLGNVTREALMVDATPVEQAALRSCLKAFGEAASRIGFDKPLGAYSESDALAVIDAIVTHYVETMAAQHDATRTAPIRTPPRTPLSLADLRDDIPF